MWDIPASVFSFFNSANSFWIFLALITMVGALHFWGPHSLPFHARFYENMPFSIEYAHFMTLERAQIELKFIAKETSVGCCCVSVR